jgi:predicted nucleic acid-binding protein
VTTAVDTNVLVDLLRADAPAAREAQARLEAAAMADELVLSECVYAELASFIADASELDRFLRGTDLRLLPSSAAALRLAGLCWREYTLRRSAALICPACGTANRIACTRCGSILGPRQHLLTDFLIGAHASVDADRLLTRDFGYYGTYFPDLVLL